MKLFLISILLLAGRPNFAFSEQAAGVPGDDFESDEGFLNEKLKEVRLSLISANTISINGVQVPPMATHYFYDQTSVRYVGGPAGTSSWPISPFFVDSQTIFSLPENGFTTKYGNFLGKAAAGVFAYFELLDEPIGIQSFDSPVVEVPTLSEAQKKEANQDRFTTIKALFDNSKLPNLSTTAVNSVWVGRCAFKSTPDVETGALFSLTADGTMAKPFLYTAARAMDLINGSVAAQADRFEQMGESSIAAATQLQTQTGLKYSPLSERPLQTRPLELNSLFFDYKKEFERGMVRMGYRLRDYTGPTGRRVVVLEGYSPFKEGASFTQKRVSYLEPLQYCYFSQHWKW